MSKRLASTRLELRLSPDDEKIIAALRKRAGFPTPTKADVIREALKAAYKREGC